MNYFIQTFGCQANKADSERMAGVLEAMGFDQSDDIQTTDVIILNTCSVRQSAEDRVYARMGSLRELKKTKPNLKVIVAGCMIGPHGDKPRDSKIANRLEGADKLIGTQDYSRLWDIFKDVLPNPKEYLSKQFIAKKMEKDHGYVLISSGCNNFCTFCIVPYARGKEISRPFADIINEVQELVSKGYKKITLLGQNVNSYGADLILGKPLGGDRIQVNEMRMQRKEENINRQAKQLFNQPTNSEQQTNESTNTAGPFTDLQHIDNETLKNHTFTLPSGKNVKPVHVKHLGKVRIPTLFPYLLEEVCKIAGVETVTFMSSNPWDFSDELIQTIKNNSKVDTQIHLPVQAGDNNVLKRMNRWYTVEEYKILIQKIRDAVPHATFTTDIIVGFPGETEEEFENTVSLCKEVNFKGAFIAEYSIRPGTGASLMKDDVKNWDKKRRFQILDELINEIKHSEVSKVKIPQQFQTSPLLNFTSNS